MTRGQSPRPHRRRRAPRLAGVFVGGPQASRASSRAARTAAFRFSRASRNFCLRRRSGYRRRRRQKPLTACAASTAPRAVCGMRHGASSHFFCRRPRVLHRDASDGTLEHVIRDAGAIVGGRLHAAPRSHRGATSPSSRPADPAPAPAPRAEAEPTPAPSTPFRSCRSSPPPPPPRKPR